MPNTAPVIDASKFTGCAPKASYSKREALYGQ
jgi:hypothetical protein